MNRVVVVTALSMAITSTVACVNERVYTEPGSSPSAMGDWTDLGGTGIAALRGTVGELDGIDSSASDMWVTRDNNARLLEMSGNVPHQAQQGSSVWLDVVVVNADQMRVGEELRQDRVVDDVWSATREDGPLLDVYVCPNGEGISGNADDIVVTKTGPDTFTFVARSTDTEQNLDVDLDLDATE